jgi:hypothetical protein
MSTRQNEPTDKDMLARGGGNATAGGVSFQASVGAIFVARLLAERSVDDRLRLAGAQPKSIRFETETPLDDILMETDASGWIFAQCKTTLSLSESLESEFGKTVEQIVKQWKVCRDGNGKRGWDRPLDLSRDRLVVAVGPGASGTITGDLAAGLGSLQAPVASPPPQAQGQAVEKLRALLTASWQRLFGALPVTQDIDDILKFVVILQFDPTAADRTAAIEMLVHVTEEADAAPAAFAAIGGECESLMAKRHGTNGPEMRRVLARTGLRLRSAPSYRTDVERLREYSERTQTHLEQYEETKVDGRDIKIERRCTAAVVTAAKDGSLVLVGEPGAGKSAVISAAAQRLRTEGKEVLELAVDRLPVESLEGLRGELGLDHSLRDVLDNWPGLDAAFLFIDALDATRGGRSEFVFRTIIADVLNLPGARWHVIASIRSFDLRLGEQFRSLFGGRPPAREFSESAFSGVRHIHVPPWTEEELTDFLNRAPEIGTAIDRGGKRVRDLALVPFNTRLLAELVTDGLSADAFGDIQSQVQLLALYWQWRVEKHGAAAELCLRNAVDKMVSDRILQAPRLDVAQADPAAFDKLLSDNVLVPVGDKKVAFRHHILFDYSASRVFIDPADIAATGELLRRERGLGLMLAPALSFALQGLWTEEQDRRARFWRAVVHFAGDAASDPIARSVAARSACELPAAAEEMNGLAHLLTTPGPDQETAFRAFSHIVGALAVRLDDRQPIQLTPWCHIAAETSVNADQVVWSLRTLLFLLVGRVETTEQLVLLGRAARAVLQVAVEQELPSQLAAAAIGFVADTYASDPPASRRLLQRLLDPVRLRRHAHEDMSWLARKVKPIGEFDPDFVVDIYRTIFGHVVADDVATSISHSRILPLSSNSRQDYEMARYALKEAFPDFLRSHPLEAIRALVAALEGYIATSHPLDEHFREEAVHVGELDASIIEDRSHIWAWNPDDAHSDNAVSLVKTFRAHLLDAPDAEARQIVNEVIRRNRFAILWSRMFMVGSQRADGIGEMLWPFATQRPFLEFYDSSKDAIDLVAARYPFEERSAREEFEQQVLRYDFPASRDPGRARELFLGRLLGAIGLDNLVNAEAQEFLRALPPSEVRPANRRPFEITSGWRKPDRFFRLTDKGIDINAEPNASLLGQTENVQKQLGLFGEARNPIDIANGVGALRALAVSASEAARRGTDPRVIENVEETVARGCERLSQETLGLRADQATLSDLCDLVATLLIHPLPQVAPDTEAKHEASKASSGGVRLDGGQAAINLCRVDEATALRFTPSLERLVRDPHPEVRLAMANSLVMLWETARETMWQLAGTIAAQEQNRRVLSFFAGSLMRLIHADPTHVEALVFAVVSRIPAHDDRPGVELREAIGSLILLLWVSHERPAARDMLKSWLDHPPNHEPELGRAVHAIQGGLVLGYGVDNDNDAAIRRRCQEFAARVVEAAARGLERYFSLQKENQTDEEARRAGSCANLLSQTGDQFYFSSGAFRDGQTDENKGLANDDLKRVFLADNCTTFRRIGDVGTPAAIFHLIEMLGFLTSADPGSVFDLVAHALLTAGRKQGYQFESLGADRFVEVIGKFLADHRELFNDADRRGQLVACLDAFVEAGWPAARRLLYRLPELLQ